MSDENRKSRALSLDALCSLVQEGAAIRAVSRLQPAGGPGDKVFPPTYATGDRAETRYALETRRIGGREVPTVLLDSVASQANRFERALLEGVRDGELAFPLVQVDFRQEQGLQDLDVITALDAPHRVADALLRDSMLGDDLFRASEVGARSRTLGPPSQRRCTRSVRTPWCSASGTARAPREAWEPSSSVSWSRRSSASER